MPCLVHDEDFALPARQRKQPRPINSNYLDQQFIFVVYNSDNIQTELEFIIFLHYKSNRPQVSMV